MIDIPAEPADDPQFLEMVCRVVSGTLEPNHVDGVFVVRINNWFDKKWLNFSGIGRVRFDDFRIDIDTALDEFRQDKVTFPPFSPNRVAAQYSFVRNKADRYVASVSVPLIHDLNPASSCENLQRRITDFSQSAIFVWFSSNTLSNLRGSLMVYEAYGPQVTTWYVAFSKTKEWNIQRVEGIAREQLQHWIVS